MHQITTRSEGDPAGDEARVNGRAFGVAAAWAALLLVCIVGGSTVAPVQPDRGAATAIASTAR